jgi:hypothetical protein
VHCCWDGDKSLARPGRKQADMSVRMAWISFGVLPCRKKETWWHLASRWNRARPWHASKLVSFLVGLRTYQHPGITFSDSFLIVSRQTLSASAYFHLPPHIAILQDFCRSYNAICYTRFLVKWMLLAVVVGLAYSNNVNAVLSLSLDMWYGKRTPRSSEWHARFSFRRCKFTPRPEDWLNWHIFEASLSFTPPPQTNSGSVPQIMQLSLPPKYLPLR